MTILPRRPAGPVSSPAGDVAAGIALGIAAVLAWSFYNVGVDIGRTDGFSSADLAVLRFGVTALLLLPFLLAGWVRGTSRLSLQRAGILALLIGPPFALLINTGYGLAPLAHAVVISPGVTMLTANFLSWRLDGKPLSANRRTGIAVLVLGLLAIALDQPETGGTYGTTWLGDLCFVGSGTLWGIFTYLVGRWRLPAIETTGTVSVLSIALFLPVYFWLWEVPQLPAALWAEQVVYQGVLGGCLAIAAFSACAARLGAGPAALFPALVPPVAVLLAIPLSSGWPSPMQWAGVALATSGLVVALDVVGRRRD